jgi:hypothetical protein
MSGFILAALKWRSAAVSDVRRQIGRDVLAIVVTRLVAGQRQQTDQRNRNGRREYRHRPADYRSSDSPPSPGLGRPLGIQQTETAAHGEHRGRQGQCGQQHNHLSDGAGNSHGTEVLQPGEVQA